MELRDVVDFYLEGILTASLAGIWPAFAWQLCEFNAKTIISSKMCGSTRQNSSTSNG
jgi:hypothetical protein